MKFNKDRLDNYSRGVKEIFSALEGLANPEEVKKNLQLMVDEKKRLDESISKYNKIKSIEKHLNEAEEKNAEAERRLAEAKTEADKLINEAQVNADKLINQVTAMYESKKAEADDLMEKAEEKFRSADELYSKAENKYRESFQKERELSSLEAELVKKQSDLDEKLSLINNTLRAVS